MTAALTPPEIAERLRVSPDKVRAWIDRGELLAVNVAERLGGRPRWRIDPEALADFERRRGAQRKPKATRRRPPKMGEVTVYY